MAGLLLSDSLMTETPKEAKDKLIEEFDLESLDVKCYGGETIEGLIGVDGRGDALMDEKTYDFVFVVGGANNFNRTTETSPIKIAKKIAEEAHTNLHLFSTRHPNANVVLAPVPYRQVSQRENERFATMSDKDWINNTNEAISLYQHCLSICPCHGNKVRHVISPSTHIWSSLLLKDGLHLTPEGKEQMVNFLIDSRPSFSLSFSDFPPLPESSGTFSFKPQVPVPTVKPKMKPVKNNNLFIHQCILSQDVSFKGPMKKKAQLVSESQAKVGKHCLIRKKKPRAKKRSEWVMPSVDPDPDFCFSQTNSHLPQPRPKLPRPKKKTNSGRNPQQEREKQEKEKKRKERGIDVPWYERLFLPSSVAQASSTNPGKVNQGESKEPSFGNISGDNFSFGVEGFGLYGSGNVNSESNTHCCDLKEVDIDFPEISWKPLCKGKKLQRHLECVFCSYMQLSSEPKFPKELGSVSHGNLIRVYLKSDSFSLESTILHIGK